MCRVGDGRSHTLPINIPSNRLRHDHAYGVQYGTVGSIDLLLVSPLQTNSTGHFTLGYRNHLYSVTK